MIRNRVHQFMVGSSVLVIAAAVFIGFAVFNGDSAESALDNGFPEWPSFVMTYEMQNNQIRNGDSTQSIKEVRRFEYTSRTQWKDEIVAAEDINNSYGTFSRVGSYKIRDGEKITRFEAVTGSIAESESPKENNVFPQEFLVRVPLRDFAATGQVELTPVQAPVRVCYQDDCSATASAVLARGGTLIEPAWFTDDIWNIPLGDGVNIVVTDLQISTEKR